MKKGKNKEEETSLREIIEMICLEYPVRWTNNFNPFDDQMPSIFSHLGTVTINEDDSKHIWKGMAKVITNTEKHLKSCLDFEGIQPEFIEEH